MFIANVDNADRTGDIPMPIAGLRWRRVTLRYASLLLMPSMSIFLTDFARPRLFPREPRRNTIQDCTSEQFERRINEEMPLVVLEGYAPPSDPRLRQRRMPRRRLTGHQHPDADDRQLHGDGLSSAARSR